MKCTFNYQAGGGCKHKATHLVEGIPFCKDHGAAIAWRIGIFRKRSTPYVEIRQLNPTKINEELSNRVCGRCGGYGLVNRMDMCPDCLGTGFYILEEPK